MPIRTFAFDASEHLDDTGSQLDYLRDALSTDNAQAIAHALGVVARARGMTQLAHDAGIDRDALYEALGSVDGAGSDTLKRTVAALTARLSVAA